jgi:uncharacterized protein YecT (DUF1311 family)
MKLFLLIVTTFTCLAATAQNITPAQKKQIQKDTEAAVLELKKKLVKENASELTIAFTLDTCRIHQYMARVMELDYSTSGMNAAGYDAAAKYDTLLNKYYKKLLAVLSAEDKKVLIQAQKAWLAFRDNEMKLVETIGEEKYSGGGTIQSNIRAANYLDMIEERTVALYVHLARATQDW